ncbi:MAG: GyrI-like domain-containing protein [Desulfobacterales bacterium]|nr:GyrI-like domain-containing protein [Desulfobacterales bacterium]
MERKQIPARNYYYAATELTVAGIPAFADKTFEPLFQSAGENQLEIVGPTEFIYLNAGGDPTKPFRLIIGLPVRAPQSSPDAFGFLETPPFECLSEDFAGPMQHIGRAWYDLFRQVQDAGYLPGNQGREVYKDWQAFDAEDNVTELQMGIAARKIPRGPI